MLNDFLRLQGNILVSQTKPQAKQQTISRKLSSAERRLSDILKSLKQQLINTEEMSTIELCMKLGTIICLHLIDIVLFGLFLDSENKIDIQGSPPGSLSYCKQDITITVPLSVLLHVVGQ